MNYLNVLKEFKELCCKQQPQIAVACRVYIDLISDKKYLSVSKCYDKFLDVVFLNAESFENKKFIILPSLITQELDLNIIHAFQKEKNESSVILALCDTSSNILYYQIFED